MLTVEIDTAPANFPELLAPLDAMDKAILAATTRYCAAHDLPVESCGPAVMLALCLQMGRVFADKAEAISNLLGEDTRVAIVTPEPICNG